MTKPLFCVFFFAICTSVFSQNNTFCEQLHDLKDLVKQSHYAPKPINDSLSKNVYTLFLKKLDKNRVLFTKNDIHLFEDDIYKFDDFINDNSCDFIQKYIDLLNKRIASSKSIINKFNDIPLDYSGKDTLYFNADKTNKYFINNEAAQKYWSKRIRFNILTKLIEDDSIFENIKTNFKTFEENNKSLIIQNEICLLDEKLNQNGGIEQFVKESFLDAFLQYHDSNSTYFNNSGKVLFENLVANNQFSFGISTVKNENGNIVISYIAPGSPAFKNVDLEVNDIIKSIQCNNDTLHAYCVSNEDVMAFINNDANETAVLKIKKSNGLIIDISLTKKRVEIENNSVRGYLIKNASSSIGYIKIPSFYTDLESPNGFGMANDAAKEIYKLKREKIQGLIIDLRFNGGGSMKEAADLSGMFIDRGPVSIIKYNDGETYTLKDYKRGTVFNKPLVVLVNQFSASASELFASVIQDYNRGIIVGSKTHGKSSAQIILPINDKGLGFAKLTVEKFYRPTGKSHQLIGVVPDITLPSLYDNFKTEEFYSEFPLLNDSISVNIKFTPNKKINIKKIKDKSLIRISQNSGFKDISSMNNQLLKNYINKSVQYPLTLDNVYNDINTYKSIWKSFNTKTNQVSKNLSFENTISTKQIIEYNDSEKENNQTILDELSNDITLIETHAILIDLINNNTID